MGVWIETAILPRITFSKLVTPYVGVWIETPSTFASIFFSISSHPTWVCGLKRTYYWKTEQDNMSHPTWVCGLKLSYPSCLPCVVPVTPYVGVWIETLSRPDYPSGSISHTLRGCVDWNFDYLFYFCFHKVTPCVGIYGLEHCSLVGQVYGRTVSIRPLMYFSPGFWFCYDWKKHVQARMLIFCLFSFVVSPRWQYIGT